MVTTRFLSCAAAVAAGLLLLSGCATTEGPEGGVRIDQQNNVRPALNSVRVIDGSLARYVGAKYKVESVLDVEGVQISPTPTGFPKVSAVIRNKTSVMIPLEVRVSWYDQYGAPTDSAASWTHLFAQPQSMVTFEQVSTRQNSAQYYIEIRGAQ
jgi:uncharacterized protein YcfL